MRKKTYFCLLLILSLFLIFIFMLSESGRSQEKTIFQGEFVPNEVLVRFKRDIPRYLIQNTIESLQGKIFTYHREEISSFDWDPNVSSLRSFLSDPYLLHVKVPASIGTEKAIYLLKLNPNVEYVEKNRILHVFTNDTYWSKLWGLSNTGQSGGTPDADIDAAEAWGLFTGSSDVVVAVIDTGVDYNHEDLAANIWTNPGESGNGKETDGIDNDGNGYIDDFRGWDFYDNDNNPMDEYTPEEGKWYHGTHVAGTIGAVGNNEKGVVGVNWDVSIMCLKVSDENGDIPVTNAINAIDYATANGAYLSNNSYGWEEDDPDFEPYYSALYNAINRAKNAGILFVAAAGNGRPGQNGWDLDFIFNNKIYPSCYTLNNIVSVAATDDDDNLAWYSCYGMYSIDLAAPGGKGEAGAQKHDIYSTKRTNLYQYMCGTSMASPHVAGVAALVWGRNSNLNYSQVRDIILDNVDELDSLQDKVVTEGRLNAYKAVLKSVIPSAPSGLNAYPTAWDEIRLEWQDNSNNEDGFKIERKTSSSEYSQIATEGENACGYIDQNVSVDITYYYRVRAYNRAGNSNYTDPDNATIPKEEPDAPSGLNGWFSYTQGAVVLSWTDNANNEQGFVIERKSEYWPFWEEIDRVGPNTTNYEDYEVDPDTFYWYRIKACNPEGDSDYSNEKRVYVPQY